MNDKNIYDMLVIGGGPGGYTAALYGARAGLKVAVLEKMYAGGQMTQSHQIDNYPGFADGIDGFSLAMQMQRQAERFGVETVITQVLGARLAENPKVVQTDSGSYYGRTVVLSTGAGPKLLELPREAELTGRGVAYCAACDGHFYRGKTVAVVGGGNSAAADALLLSRVAEKVYLIHRRDTLRAEKIYHQALENAENIEFVWNSSVEALLGDIRLSGIEVQNKKSGEKTVLDCQGLFVSIGRKPATQWLEDQLPLDENGYILADESTKTAIPGVYAVGDVRSKAVRQIVTAVADGAVAAHQAEEFLAQ
jgi:thioredoxin reductase (NADPH)